jgi:hypothetical protein
MLVASCMVISVYAAVCATVCSVLLCCLRYFLCCCLCCWLCTFAHTQVKFAVFNKESDARDVSKLAAEATVTTVVLRRVTLGWVELPSAIFLCACRRQSNTKS